MSQSLTMIAIMIISHFNFLYCVKLNGKICSIISHVLLTFLVWAIYVESSRGDNMQRLHTRQRLFQCIFGRQFCCSQLVTYTGCTHAMVCFIVYLVTNLMHLAVNKLRFHTCHGLFHCISGH